MIPHAAKPEIPSRHDNPFATCWTRPGALAFRFPDGQTAEQLVAKLQSYGWRAAIVGPHGSGKSTLLETLKPTLVARGCHIHAVTLRHGQRRLPDRVLDQLNGEGKRNQPTTMPAILIVDGYQQLGLFQWMKLRRICRQAHAGLLVTAHAPTRLPTLIRLAPDRGLVERLVNELSAQVSTDVAAADVAASHACHGSNVREIIFDLYDRHEQLRKHDTNLRAGRRVTIFGIATGR
jgi:hypothetical protein